MGKTKRQKKTSNRKTQPPAFTKVKKKVGKKQIPTNATRVDFKSRQIHLRSQLASVYDSTSRLSTYLQQLKHHNDNTRVHAIESLQQLATKEPGILDKSLSNVMYSLEPLFTDDNSEVQKQFRVFLTFLFSNFPADQFIPYISLTVAYLLAALTHHNVTVQTTGLYLGRNLVTFLPREISHHVHTILPKYLSILTGNTHYHNLRTNRLTFSQLVTPRVSTNILSVKTTLDQCMLIFESIKLASALLVPPAKSPTFHDTSTLIGHTVLIAPRFSNVLDRSIIIHDSVVVFFTSYLSTSWFHFKELHSSLSNSSLPSLRIEQATSTISTIIDTYMLIPRVLTINVLGEIESSLVEDYSSREEAWVEEIYTFFNQNFPIEIARSNPAFGLQSLNWKFLSLYVSVHIFSNSDKLFAGQKMTDFIESIDITNDDVISLTSILDILKVCKQTEYTCGCSHLIQTICGIVWDYLQQNSAKSVLNFVIFLLEYYCEISNKELLTYLNNIFTHLLPLLQQCKLTESTICKIVNSLSYMLTRSCTPPPILPALNGIILYLLTSLTNLEYSQQLQEKVIHLTFFSDLDDFNFLHSILNDVMVYLSTEKLLCLLDVLFASYKTNIHKSSFSRFLKELSTITNQTDILHRINCYLLQL